MSDSPARGPDESPPQEVPIASEVSEIGEQMETHKQGPSKDRDKSAALIPRIGGILGILSTLVAVPIAVNALVHLLIVKPKSSVEAKEMVINYDQKNNNFRLNFPLYVRNDGNADDSLTPEGHVYYSPSASSNDIMNSYAQRFDQGLGDFEFYGKGMPEALTSADEIYPPIPISKESSTTMLLSVSLDTDSLQSTGLNLLDVELQSDKGPHPHLLYCFYLDEQQIKEIKDKNIDGHKRFLGSECGG